MSKVNDQAPSAVIVYGHGSRRSETQKELGDLAAMLAERYPTSDVVAAYAEFCQPSLAVAMADIEARGHKRVVIIPLFLFSGKHCSVDLVAEIEELQGRYSHMEICRTHHIGADPILVDIMAARLEAASIGHERV